MEAKVPNPLATIKQKPFQNPNQPQATERAREKEKMGEDSLSLQLHKLSSKSNETTTVDHILETLWKTRRTGLGAHQRSYIQSLLNLPSPQELDPLLACLRWLIRRCVHDNLTDDDIHKLFPVDLPLELQSTLVMLLQKHQSQWKEEVSREQMARISDQVKVNAPPVTARLLASEISPSMWPRRDDVTRNFNCNDLDTEIPINAVPRLPHMALHRDDGPLDNLAILPRLKSLTWTMENRKSTASKRVAVITLKLQDFSKTPSGETEVKFQLSKDTLEAMLRSMVYISEQLSNAAGLPTGPVQKKLRQ